MLATRNLRSKVFQAHCSLLCIHVVRFLPILSCKLSILLKSLAGIQWALGRGAIVMVSHTLALAGDLLGP